jgi:hypothetical protein
MKAWRTLSWKRVVAGVGDGRVDVAVGLLGVGECLCEGVCVGGVAGVGGDEGVGELGVDGFGVLLGGVVVDVDEGDARALVGEGPDDGGADALGAAGDEDVLVGEVGEGGGGGGGGLHGEVSVGCSLVGDRGEGEG